MIKICKACSGSGYETFSERDYYDEWQDISFTCSECGGSGFLECNSTLVIIKILDKNGDYLDGVILDIENTVNRPNNPDIDDIVNAYVSYNYGDVEYSYKITPNKNVVIGEDWNIEDYR